MPEHVACPNLAHSGHRNYPVREPIELSIPYSWFTCLTKYQDLH